MICIVMLAGHGTRLERELREDTSGKYSSLVGVPKGLLPFCGKALLDIWWSVINRRELFDEVYLVTNAHTYKYYERWATANEFPVDHVINDGTTIAESRLGAMGDLALALRSQKIAEDICVIAGDMAFYPDSFDLKGFVKFFETQRGELVSCYNLPVRQQLLWWLPILCQAHLSLQASCQDDHTVVNRGIVETENEESSRIKTFLEKPGTEQTSSRLAAISLFCFRKETIPTICDFVDRKAGRTAAFGEFLETLVTQVPVFCMRVPAHFDLIGSNVSLRDYERVLAQYETLSKNATAFGDQWRVHETTQARVGLMGNPSDGFHGKTIALSIKNFWAEVTLTPSDKLRLVPHPLNDPTEFGGLSDLHGISRLEGYQGGLRLMQAVCKRFFEYCASHGIALHRRNFAMSYDTNIPRQVGLAGSSAIVACCMKALLRFYGLTYRDMPKPLQPQFILDVESKELGINAGLQDRVIQVYEGCVFMDFAKDLMDKRGFGDYKYVPTENLPVFFMTYLSDPSDSGKIHSDVKMRWLNGDKEIIDGMKLFGDYTSQAQEAILSQDWDKLADLMDANFSLRRKLYGDAVVGADNLRMIEISQAAGAAAKFTGSGGAVVGLLRRPPERSDEEHAAALQALRRSHEEAGFIFTLLTPNPAEVCE